MSSMPGPLHACIAIAALASCSQTETVIVERPVQPTRHPDSGLYAVWTGGLDNEAYSLPLLRGGQVVVQWADVHPQPESFDFSLVEHRLRQLAERNLKATVQVNGNIKPPWLFETIPYRPGAVSHQVGDESGSLMYWHPRHLAAHKAMIRSLASFLDESAYRHAVAGVRQNMNAFGTEHLWLRPEERARELWEVPDENDWIPYSDTERDNYAIEVTRTYVDSMPQDIQVLLRTTIPQRVLSENEPRLRDGSLGLFHTSSEPQPRSRRGDYTYRVLLDYARPGITLAYAESWADAWGRHGRKQDPRKLSPAQWNYWRLLFDLNNGVSMIAVYGTDLREAVAEARNGPGSEHEFYPAFSFAAGYAGFHAIPETSPGAWVAFRDTGQSDPEDGRAHLLYEDLTFHMKRVAGGSTAARLVGPDGQRFGAWAREIDIDEPLEVEVDGRFVESLTGAAVTIHITVLSEGPGELSFQSGDTTHRLRTSVSNRWLTLNSPPVALTPATGSHAAGIRLMSSRPIWVHMVEVRRPD